MEQNFSTTNLKRIWDLRTRRGDHRLLDLYPSVKQAYLDRRDARRELRRASRLPLLPGAKESLAEAADAATQRADSARDDALASTSESLIATVESGTFSWGLHETKTVNGRRTFGLAATSETFFAEQVLQRAIAEVTPNRPSSRQSVISNVARVLDTNVPKLVIRTDFDRFYESVDHALLVRALGPAFLSPTFRGLISALLQETQKLLGASRGLPTGVGLSAKLAEFFLADFDRAMSSTQRTLYYGRYVDDVVAVLGETEHGELNASLEKARIAELAGQYGLRLSASKTLTTRTDHSWHLPQFDLLGYKIKGEPKIVVGLTDLRQSEIKRRIDLAFDAWAASNPNSHGNRRLFLDRLRYITGNFRLANNKRNAFIGMYFSNPHLNDDALLQNLDQHLNSRLSAAGLPADVYAVAARLTFTEGFKGRRLHRFTSQQLVRVRRAWNA
jgi:hypothetical protein